MKSNNFLGVLFTNWRNVFGNGKKVYVISVRHLSFSLPPLGNRDVLWRSVNFFFLHLSGPGTSERSCFYLHSSFKGRF